MSASSFARKFGSTIGLSVWVVGGFIGAQIIVGVVYVLLVKLLPVLAGLNAAISVTLLAALSYTLALILLITVPRLFNRPPVTRQLLGFHRLVSWGDIGLAILAVLPYVILTSIITGLATQLLHLDTSVKQDIPFEHLALRYEYLVAFMTLVIIAPVAEELIFRGYFFGKLKTVLPGVATVLVVALVFGAMHLIGAPTKTGITLQWAVAADTFALGLVLGGLRLLTGSVWAGILLHMLKNAVAFYALFISPLMTGTM